MKDVIDPAAMQSLCDALETEFAWLHPSDPPVDAKAEVGDAAQRLEALNQRIDALSGEHVQSALCLSGGGIRSATFCLGALQGLAQVKLLDQFHYLSTVSGGGYIGGWLSSWVQREGLDNVVQALAGAAPATPPPASPTASPADQLPQSHASSPRPVDRLRAYTNYLSPVWGLSIDALTLAATFMRNLALHWSVIVPLLVAALLFPRLQVTIQAVPASPDALVLAFALGVLAIFGAVTYIASDLPGELTDEAQAAGTQPHNHFGLACMLPLFVAALLLSWVGAWLARSGQEYAVKKAYLDPFFRQLPDMLTGGGLPQVWSWQVAACFAIGGALVHVMAAGCGWRVRPMRGLAPRRYTYPGRALLASVVTGFIGGLGLFGFFWLVCVPAAPLHAETMVWGPAAGGEVHAGWENLYALLSVPALFMVFWNAVTFFVGVLTRYTSGEDREWWSRASAASIGASLAWMAAVLLVVCLPHWILLLPFIRQLDDPKTLVGVGTGLIGVLTSAFGYWSKRGPALKRQVEGIGARLGASTLDIAALAFAVLLVVAISFGSSYALERWVLLPDFDQQQVNTSLIAKSARDAKALAACQQAQPARCPLAAEKAPPGRTAIQFAAVLRDSPWQILVGLIGSFALFGSLAMVATGVNAYSLHNMYCNRLVRAYLGATRTSRSPHWFTGFDVDDNLPMAALKVSSKRLFPVVNTALNLAAAAGDRLEWQQRKAASFTITPQHCGSAALGFVPTGRYARLNETLDPARPGYHAPTKEPLVDQTLGGLTLGRAIAISGAAASPNMGYHTSKLVAFAMSFFNVRLGWWVPNPMKRFEKQWSSEEPRYGLGNALAEATAGTSAKRSFVYLSDGGHFENLGLYEMIRRRCRRILVIDATEDPKFLHMDLESSIRKMRIDFGAEVLFPKGLPSAESVRRTGQHFAVGSVKYKYSDVPGTIIYIKPALSGDEPLDVLHYAASQQRAGAAFPHDPTSHQNFDEAQFESYRVLGWHSILTAFEALPGDPWRLAGMPDHRPPTPSGATAGSPPAPVTPGAAAPSAPGAGSWRQLATGALLGSLAVTGTVALKEGGTVGLKEGAQVALSEGAKVRLDPDPLTLKPVTVKTDLKDALEALTRSIGTGGNTVSLDVSNGTATATVTPIGITLGAGSLVAALEKLAQAMPTADERKKLREQIGLLAEALKNRQSALPPDIAIRLEAAATAFSRTAIALEKSVGQTPTPVNNDAAVAELAGIRRAIENMSPRRNVSGTGEGGRP